MSLYNMIFAKNSNADKLLAILGLTEANVPRYRDCWYDTSTNQIVIHTRTGGGNREFYSSEESARENYPEYFKDDTPTGSPYNCDLQAHPLYINDEDDEGDSTYANFYFAVPDDWKDKLKQIYEGTTSIRAAEKWKILLDSIGKA